MRFRCLALTMVLALGGCSWFGHKDEIPPTPAGPTMSSDEILNKDCSDENWKQQNLGLWYSVCRQPMKW
jgi:hypothetical protein